MQRIRIAIVGAGNCASALVQGIHFYRASSGPAPGLLHPDLGGYAPGDIEPVAAFDIDARKVGRDLCEAVFALPNCTARFFPDLPASGVMVRMAPLLDGVGPHMRQAPAHRTFVPADAPEPSQEEIIRILRDSGATVLLNYLPVGSEQAARFWAECCLAAGLGLVNCMPVFLASDPVWAGRFRSAGLPLVGDDIKSQLGATVVHRTLADLFRLRGAPLDRTYQLNTGGNTDFLNMLERSRLASKRLSKTEAVQAAAGQRLADEDIHVGPSDYVAWQNDNKVCFLRLEGRLFGNVPMHLELRLSVEDSPNSAGVAVDAVRCCQVARDRGLAGPLEGPCAFLMKHPPVQHPDPAAWEMMEEFIRPGIC